jgi:segregation and condensation protein B
MIPVTDEINGVPSQPDLESSVTLSNGHPAAVDTVESADAAAQAVAARELKAIVESLLFVSPEPLSVQRLLAVIGDVTKAEVMQALRTLGEELEQEGRGLRLAEVAGGFRLLTKQEYAGWIKRLDKSKSTAKLSRSALESLAIIAYKQPIVRSEIEEIRGVETSGVVRTLLERKLVRIVGRKEVPGRPIMYGTTKYFLEHFGLNDLSQLPPLREFKELGESEQAVLPMDEADRFTTNGSAEAATAPVVQVVFEQSADPSEAPNETGAPPTVEPDTSLLDEPVQQV